MVYRLTLEPTSWLATLTCETMVTIYTNGDVQEQNKITLAEGFKGFFFQKKWCLGSLCRCAGIRPHTCVVGPNLRT
jgi:hypothetical protein